MLSTLAVCLACISAMGGTMALTMSSGATARSTPSGGSSYGHLFTPRDGRPEPEIDLRGQQSQVGRAAAPRPAIPSRLRNRYRYFLSGRKLDTFLAKYDASRALAGRI